MMKELPVYCSTCKVQIAKLEWDSTPDDARLIVWGRHFSEKHYSSFNLSDILQEARQKADRPLDKTA